MVKDDQNMEFTDQNWGLWPGFDIKHWDSGQITSGKNTPNKQ
jgi:hypothetical protein